MNRFHLKIAFLVVSVALFFACQSNESNQTDANLLTKTSEKQVYRAVGIIKHIDADAVKLTIDHEDIAGYMSAMKMDFEVIKIISINNFKIGDKIEFELERTGEKLLVTKITKIGEVVSLNGGEIYKINCAECHGADGEGTKKGIPFISGHALHHSEKEFVEQVINGEGEKMPAFKAKLSAEQIAEVVKFVRNNLQQNVQKLENHTHH
jgi:Cu/Ag efflux protein CusF